MTTDIKELAAVLRRAADKIDSERGHKTQHTLTLHKSAAALETMAGEVAEALPWKMFYKDGLDLEQIGKRLGKSPYDFSPWLYAPLISQLKDREKTALADLAAERDRLAGEVERLKDAIERNARNCIDTMNKMHEQHTAERDRLAGKVASLKETITTAEQFNEGLAAERDRLKAALDEAVKWMDGCAVSGGYPKWHAKARKALGGDAS